MTPSLLDTFRTLAAFAPSRRSLRGAPWEAYVDWAVGQGLAPLAAYNLEYRLGGADAPEWVRDRLLSLYQGSLNDNVMKLVNFKRAVDTLEGRQVLLWGSASLADVLYPHVAFRPVLDVRLLAAPADVAGLVGFLGRSEFRPEGQAGGGAAAALSDGRTEVRVFDHLLPARALAEERGVWDRSLPLKVYGPSLRRLSHEDALLAACLEQARDGYEVPLLTFVDLRELVLGAPSLGGPYSRTPDASQVRQRAQAWRISRAVYASLSIVERLFPETAEAVRAMKPAVPAATRAMLERWLVEPLSTLGRLREVRGAARWRRLLSGG